MKKNYFIISFLFLVCTITNAQEKNNSTQLNELLNRLNTAGNSMLKEPVDLFTPAERTILHNHLSKSEGFNNSTLALGDNYMVNLRANPNVFGTIPATGTGPYTLASIANITDDYYAGDFTSAGTLYAVNVLTSNLETINIATGTTTVVAPLSGIVVGQSLGSLSWNHANSTMYALGAGGSVTSLYTLNLSTGALTFIGNCGNTLGIWLAINSTGGAFMADLATDSLYSINLTTGIATLIGTLGINLNFAQGADFDSLTDTLFMTAYTGSGVNQYCSINTTTGFATQLGTINNNNAECDISSIYRNNLSVNEVNLEASISVFPNPTNGMVNIVNNQNLTVEKVTIFDMNGRIVKEMNLENTMEQTVNIADLATGVYNMTIQTQSGKISKKLAKR